MITQEELKKHLNYNQETGVFIWLTAPSTNVHIGDIAGSLNSIGYISIRINKVQHSAHRLAWLYINGELPKSDLDHINGKRNDNRINNLRVASRSENNLNCGKHRDNKSGYKGVTFNKRKEKWMAQARFNNKNHFLGYFLTPKEASDAYEKFAINNHGEFYYQQYRG